ncbi:hypothetical protein FOL46_008900 [Perkinsus olseni]|uniref:Uncharacterized protein n=1 Tax=Perkinsus olseni TaxID=32597 RepID=A0A7J6L4I5_PEROL|nr:hypothetical protein FOL46_008900 [Perkinsus olseni]
MASLVYSYINPSTEATGATQFIAGSYPLRPGPGSKFFIDYNARTVFPRLIRGGSLCDQIKKDCPDSQVADGDLTTITFATRDTVIMMLGKEMVTLSRTDGDAVNIYRQSDPNGSYEIEYLVTTNSFPAADSYYGSFKKLEITVTCIRALSPVLLTATVSEFFTSFEFTQVKGHAEFQISGLPDLNALVGFKNEVKSVCAVSVDPDDWHSFIFASPSTMLTQFQGRSVAGQLA